MKKFAKTMIAALAAAMATAAPAASAQTDCMFNNPENRIFLGVRAGVDITSAADGNSYYSNAAGFHAGAVYNIPLWKNLYFEPGLMLFYDVFGTRSPMTVNISAPGTSIPPTVDFFDVTGSVRNLGFRIPMMAGYHFDFADDLKVSAFTGPELNLSLLAHYHNGENPIWSEVANGVTYTYKLDPYMANQSMFGTNGFKHVDLGWRFGVGVEYMKYYASLSGSLGLTRLKDHTPYWPCNVRRNIFSITLGYNF